MMSRLILWWLSTRFPAKIAATAPTAHQLEGCVVGRGSQVAPQHGQSVLPGSVRSQE